MDDDQLQAELYTLRAALLQARHLLETTPTLMPAKFTVRWERDVARFLAETADLPGAGTATVDATAQPAMTTR